MQIDIITIFPEMFPAVLGASITREGASAIIKGVERLSGAPVTAPDLRASAALILAGMAADNHTELNGLEHLDRGYEHLEHQLARLGGKLRRVAE